ncbi:hypothetical protein JCM21900_006553 [Sporobolomyces salmonicolor]
MSRVLFGPPASPWPAFHAVNDTVRGGSSSSAWTVDPGTLEATFTGHLDIETLGGAGFASQATTFSPSRLAISPAAHAGVVLTFRLPPAASPASTSPARPHAFVLTLKNDKPALRPDGRRESVTSYEFEVDLDLYRDGEAWADEDKENEKEIGRGGRARRTFAVLARWDEFTPTYRGREQRDANPLDPTRIYELGFMCRSNFAQQAGDFSFEIVSLEAAAPAAKPGWLGWIARGWAALSGLMSGWVGVVSGWWKGEREGRVRLP